MILTKWNWSSCYCEMQQLVGNGITNHLFAPSVIVRFSFSMMYHFGNCSTRFSLFCLIEPDQFFVLSHRTPCKHWLIQIEWMISFWKNLRHFRGKIISVIDKSYSLFDTVSPWSTECPSNSRWMFDMKSVLSQRRNFWNWFFHHWDGPSEASQFFTKSSAEYTKIYYPD